MHTSHGKRPKEARHALLRIRGYEFTRLRVPPQIQIANHISAPGCFWKGTIQDEHSTHTSPSEASPTKGATQTRGWTFSGLYREPHVGSDYSEWCLQLAAEPFRGSTVIPAWVHIIRNEIYNWRLNLFGALAWAPFGFRLFGSSFC